MRVEVEREVATKMIKVWVIQDGASDGRPILWQPIRDQFTVEVGERLAGDWVVCEAGVEMPPSLRLPEDIWVGMLAAGGDVPMPSRAQFDHLADAREMRDRLLTLVESAWNQNLPHG